MSFCTFQFPPGWPSHIYCLSVFPRKIPIPTDWLEQKNLKNAYHPVCNCNSYSNEFFQDPAVSAWYLGICPYKYPYGLYKYAQNILIVNLDDKYLLNWLQDTHKFEIMSYLTDLEYFVYDEFNSFLQYLITMFQFSRYSKITEQVVELKAKVFGMAHGKVLVCKSTSLGVITDLFSFNSHTKSEWKSQLFFSIRSALKRDYFDKFISIHSYLDQVKELDSFDI